MNRPLPINSLTKYPECSEAYRVSHSPLRVAVGTHIFEAFVNTLNLRTEVGWMVATQASIDFGSQRRFSRTIDAVFSEILVPLNLNGRTRTLNCAVIDSPNNAIIFGLDALNCFGCHVTISNVPHLNMAGCTDTDHQSTYDIPILKEIPKPAPIKEVTVTKIRPKNPIDLNIPEDAAPTNTEPSPEKPRLAWSELILTEPENEFEKAAMDYVMTLDDAQLDDYLQLDTDKSEVE